MHLDELRSTLLLERETGTLTQIPPDLYIRTNNEIRAYQQDVYATEDPFSDEARVLIEKVASIRETIDEIFKIRAEKVLFLAQSQADGGYIGREDLRVLIPSELEMFNRIVDAIRECRSELIDGKVLPVRHIIEPIPDETEEPPFIPERASEPEESYPVRNNAPEEDFPYALVRVYSDMEPFMGLDGRTYDLAAGDILTIPRRNAEVLAERDIVLNINPG